MKRLILALALIAVPASADIDVVRRNYIDYYTAAGAPRSSERMQKSLSEIEWAAGHFSQPGWLLSDGSWTDINYLETPSGVWSPSEHVRRVWLMTKAYRTAGQRHHGDAALRGHIESGLRKVNEFYGAWVIPDGFVVLTVEEEDQVVVAVRLHEDLTGWTSGSRARRSLRTARKMACLPALSRSPRWRQISAIGCPSKWRRTSSPA